MRIRTDRLPSGYTELTSITSTGTQYINTEYFWQSENVMIEAEFKVLSNSSYQSLWGSEEPYPGGDRYFAGIPHGSNGTFGFYIGTSAPASVAIGLNSKVKIKMQAANSKLSVWKDDTQVVNQATINGHINNFFYMSTKTQNSGRIYIFANHNSGSAGTTATAIQQIGSMELFSFKMTDNGKLVRNFIPAKRNSDGAIGLYETIRGLFHENIGMGIFTTGDEVGKGTNYNNLPDEYQEVEYISNADGNQYLEIPFIPNAAKGFRVELGFNPTATGKRYCILSNYNVGSSQLSLELTADNKSRMYINSGNKDVKSTNTFNANTFNTTILEFKDNKYNIILNGILTTGDYTFSGASSSTTMYAFLDKAKRTTTFPTLVKFYYMRLYEEDKASFNLIPCYKKSDNTAGMYDTVNNIFYSNKGTGTFIVGKDIITTKYSSLKIRNNILPIGYKQLEYVQFNGTSSEGQCIRTGVNQLAHPYYVKTVYNKTNTEVRDQCLVGQRQIGKYSNLFNTYYETAYGNTVSGSIIENQKTILLMKSGEGVIVNGTNIKTTDSTATMSTSYELLIGCFSEADYTGAKWFYSGYIYEIEIASNNEIIRHYIPCCRLSDNTVGLYDIINDTFNENVGSGSLTAGPIKVRKFKPVSTLLPLDYQQVEYIANSGTQCINTLYKWSTNNTRVIADISVDTNSASQSVWGNEEYYSGSSRYFSGVLYGSGGTYQFFVGSSTGLSGISVTLGTRTKIEVSAINNKYCIIKNGSVVRDNFTYNGTVMAGYNASTYTTNSGNFFIFANHNSGTNGQTVGPTQVIGAMKVYSFKMYDNDVLVRDFIPCYRKSDNVIGLYDLVTRNFFVNAGTGTFTKGSNVNNFI